MPGTMEKPVKVYRYDEVRARSKPPVPLDLVYEGPLDLGDVRGPDQERKAVQRVVGERFGKRVRGCSTLAGGSGYSLVIDTVEPHQRSAHAT